MTGKTLEEHAAAVEQILRDVDGTWYVRGLAAAYEAAMGRVRELEAEVERARSAQGGAENFAEDMTGRAEKAEADLAETRAQLARLREAATPLTAPAIDGYAKERADLRSALSTPGPTLASIRAEVMRAEVLRAKSLGSEYVYGWLLQRVYDLEDGRG